MAASATLGYVDVDPGVAAAFESAVDVLVTLGVRVDEVDPGFADPIARVRDAVVRRRRGVAGARCPRTCRPAWTAGWWTWRPRARGSSAVGYLAAMAVRGELGVRMGEFHERYDLLVTPTLPITAFAAGVEVPPGWPRERWTSWTPFTYPFNMTQQPAASVPCGLVNGLPVGLQIVGPRHADGRVLALAHAFQQCHRLAPAPPAAAGLTGRRRRRSGGVRSSTSDGFSAGGGFVEVGAGRRTRWGRGAKPLGLTPGWSSSNRAWLAAVRGLKLRRPRSSSRGLRSSSNSGPSSLRSWSRAPVAYCADLPDRAAQPRGGAREPLGPEDEQPGHDEDEDLAPPDAVEHAVRLYPASIRP